jgi:hypothetical protein
MDSVLRELEAECERAAQEFLQIEGWSCPKWKVRDAVAELRAGSPLATSAMEWLLRQTLKLPVQAEPNRRLHDLVHAIAARKNREITIASTAAESTAR